jgi:hypothetical protein
MLRHSGKSRIQFLAQIGSARMTICKDRSPQRHRIMHTLASRKSARVCAIDLHPLIALNGKHMIAQGAALGRRANERSKL